MTEEAIAAILVLGGITEEELPKRARRQIDSARRDAATAAELTEQWRGRHVVGSYAAFTWPHEPVPFDGIVERVFVGNPYQVPHARLTDGRIVPLPELDVS